MPGFAKGRTTLPLLPSEFEIAPRSAAANFEETRSTNGALVAIVSFVVQNNSTVRSDRSLEASTLGLDAPVGDGQGRRCRHRRAIDCAAKAFAGYASVAAVEFVGLR